MVRWNRKIHKQNTIALFQKSGQRSTDCSHAWSKAFARFTVLQSRQFTFKHCHCWIPAAPVDLVLALFWQLILQLPKWSLPEQRGLNNWRHDSAGIFIEVFVLAKTNLFVTGMDLCRQCISGFVNILGRKSVGNITKTRVACQLHGVFLQNCFASLYKFCLEFQLWVRYFEKWDFQKKISNCRTFFNRMNFLFFKTVFFGPAIRKSKSKMVNDNQNLKKVLQTISIIH